MTSEKDDTKKSKIMEQHIGVILSTLVVSFILGTAAMVYSSDKSSQVLGIKIGYLLENIQSLQTTMSVLQTKVEINTRDRWTRDDHKDYADIIELRVGKIEDRILKMEVNTLKDK